MLWLGFHSAPLTDSDIEAKPIVLLIGQYSTVRQIGCLLKEMERERIERRGRKQRNKGGDMRERERKDNIAYNPKIAG